MTSKKSKPQPAAAAASPLPTSPAPAAVEPLEGWELRTPFGFMAYGPGPECRLVRLADVVRWLGERRQLPLIPAVDEVCRTLPDDVMGWMYQLDRVGDFASPMQPNHAFGFETAADIEAENQSDARAAEYRSEQYWSNRGGGLGSAEWLGRDEFLGFPKYPDGIPPEPTDPGRPALVKLLQKRWGGGKGANRAGKPDVLDDPRAVASLLAIPITKAYEIYGWGTVAETSSPAAGALEFEAGAKDLQSRLQSLAKRRHQHKHKRWTDEDRDELKALYWDLKDQASNQTEAVLKLASVLALQRHSVEKALGEALGKRPTMPGSSVFSMGQPSSKRPRTGTG